MKRILYLLAAVCFLGVGICVVRWANLREDVGRTLQEVQDQDPAAREDVEALREPNVAADELLRDAGYWFVGGVVCVLLARRPWPTTDERRR